MSDAHLFLCRLAFRRRIHVRRSRLPPCQKIIKFVATSSITFGWRKILRSPTLLHSNYPFSTGQVCTIYYDCFQLSPNDLARLAAEAVGHLDRNTFDVAVGVAYSGILFAAAVAGGELVGILKEDGTLYGPDVRGKRVVVVDDVVHEGKRMGGAAQEIKAEGARIVGYACIVDRSEGRVGAGDVPLWSAYQTNMI